MRPRCRMPMRRQTASDGALSGRTTAKISSRPAAKPYANAAAPASLAYLWPKASGGGASRPRARRPHMSAAAGSRCRDDTGLLDSQAQRPPPTGSLARSRSHRATAASTSSDAILRPEPSQRLTLSAGTCRTSGAGRRVSTHACAIARSRRPCWVSTDARPTRQRERFRFVANEIQVIEPDAPLPKLPWHGRYGDPSPTYARPPRRGSPPAVPTTRFCRPP